MTSHRSWYESKHCISNNYQTCEHAKEYNNMLASSYHIISRRQRFFLQMNYQELKSGIDH